MKYKSASFTQASGSINGMTYSRNKGGNYVRSRALPTNPNTPAQVARRAALGRFAAMWATALTQPQREAWNAYATTVTITDKLGDPVQIAGIAHYIRTNSLRDMALVPPVTDPPTSMQPAISLSNVAITSTSTQNQIGYDINPTGWEAEDGAFVLIQQTRQMSPGIESARGKPYQFSGATPGNATTPPTAGTQPNIFPMAAGQRAFVRARAIAADGAVGQPQVFGPLTVTDAI